MTQRFMRVAVAIVSLSAAPLAAQVTGAGQLPGGVTAAPLTLAQLEEMALANSPVLAQSTADIEAARGRARQAGLLPNPTIGYSADEVSGGPVIRGGQQGFFIDQTFPLWGKLRLGRQVFEREATQFEAVRESERQRLLNDVRMLYYDALAADRRVEVQDRLANLAADALGTTRQLFNTGAADQPDVLESEVEVREAQLSAESSRNDRSRIWRRLAATVGNAALTPRPLDGSIDAKVPELDRDTLLAQVLEHSPEVVAARAAVARAEAEVSRTRRETAPDLVVRGGPRYNRELLNENGQPIGWQATFEVGLVVPLFNRNQGTIAAAGAELTRAQKELTRLDLALRARAADAFDGYLTSLRRAEVYRTDVIPRAERSYQLYLGRYREMGAAYPQVLVAQRTFFRVSNMYIDAAVEAWRRALELQGFLLTGSLERTGGASMRMGAGTENGRPVR